MGNIFNFLFETKYFLNWTSRGSLTISLHTTDYLNFWSWSCFPKVGSIWNVASTTCSDKWPRGIFLTKMNSLTWVKMIWHLFGIVMLKFCFKCIHFFSKISIFSSKFSLYEYPKQVSTTSSKDSSVSMKGKYSDF